MTLHRTRPHMKRVVWGGARLGGQADGEGGAIGEAFDVSGLDRHSCTLVSGPFAGRALADVWREDPGHFLAPPHPDRFPLLVKRIDAAQSLSVQVHPDDEAARRLENEPNGKSEAWVVLDADPGAAVYLGFRGGVGAEDVRTALADGRILELLRPVPVRRGDVIPVPPGTVHSIGAGVYLFEVQQPSDVTYRLYDHGRAPGRDLHVEEGFDVMRLDARPQRPSSKLLECHDGCARIELVDMGAFVIEGWTVHGTMETAIDGLAAIQGFDGAARVSRDGTDHHVTRGDTLVHVAGGGPLTVTGDRAELLVALHRP